MRVKFTSCVAAMVLALSTAAAIAQTGPAGQTSPGTYTNPGSAYNPAIKPPTVTYDQGGADAQKNAAKSQGVAGQTDTGGAHVGQDHEGSATAQKSQ
jgi:hypothetical protein